MNQDISKKSHIELANKMNDLDKIIDLLNKKINLLLLERELIRQELVKRIPTLEQKETFKKKTLKNV